MTLTRQIAGISLIFSLFLGLTACSSSGDGDDLVTPTLPADAARITAANAADIANAAFGSIEGLTSATTAFRGDAELPSLFEIVQAAGERVKSKAMLPAPIAYQTETQDCEPSSPQGRITVDFDATSNSAEGSAVFSNCVLGGITMNGRFTFDSTFNDTSGDYSDRFNGSLTISFGSESFTMQFDFTDSGNSLSGVFTSSIALSVSGIPGGGFLVTSTAAVTGVGTDVLSGVLLVQGADNTKLRIRITGANAAAVDFDDGSGYVNDFLTCTNLVCA